MILVTAPKNKAVFLATTGGAAVSLAPGETRRLPPIFGLLAVRQGCAVRPDAPDAPDAPAAPAAPAVSPPDGAERMSAIAEAVRALVADGNKEAFTVDGKPRTAAVAERTGFTVSAAEVAAVFEVISADDAGQ